MIIETSITSRQSLICSFLSLNRKIVTAEITNDAIVRSNVKKLSPAITSTDCFMAVFATSSSSVAKGNINFNTAAAVANNNQRVCWRYIIV